MSLDVAGTSELFIKHLEEKGFTQVGTLESSTSFIGKFANEIVKLTVLASPRTHTVCKVFVLFPEKDTWAELKEDYFKKKRLYDSKYVKNSDFEFFNFPYEDGDGYELKAVKSDKCNFCTFFDEVGGHITVEIAPSLQIKITYEDSENIKVAQEELEANAFDDI